MWNRKLVQAAIVIGAFAIAAPVLMSSDAATPKKAMPAKKVAPNKTATVQTANSGIPITVSDQVPSELNPTGGGAPAATPYQAAAFAWQEFIALNWPTAPQQTGSPMREMSGGTACPFGSTTCGTPLVWETMRSKVETFPGNNKPPPGYVNQAPNYGYDAPPAYNYGNGVIDGPCNPAQANDPTPWINLDETDQITLDNMYAGAAPANVTDGNSAPQLIRFLAKSNRVQYQYVTSNSNPNSEVTAWWNVIPASIDTATKAYLAKNMAAPPPGSSTMISNRNGTIELKAGWRELTSAEAASGRFHTQMVRFYEQGKSKFSVCWRDSTWGLVSLHVIQKTPTAPYFIYATFEQGDNILTAGGQPVEDADGVPTHITDKNGNVITPPATATTPQVCMMDPIPPKDPTEPTYPSASGSVVLGPPSNCMGTQSGGTYCTSPGQEIYYLNAAGDPPNSEPDGGFICVNKRINPITPDVVTENMNAHTAIKQYLAGTGAPSSPFLYYKLVNVQYVPYDHVVPGTSQANDGWLYMPNTSQPSSGQNPTAGSYYLANIVVETNRSLQQFSGGLSPNISTVWNADDTPHKNSYYGGHFYNMGGCMGCHGSQGQNPTTNPSGDFSVILSRGAVITPETPAPPSSTGATAVARNRSLSK
jgi:hypothetical protein